MLFFGLPLYVLGFGYPRARTAHSPLMLLARAARLRARTWVTVGLSLWGAATICALLFSPLAL